MPIRHMSNLTSTFLLAVERAELLRVKLFLDTRDSIGLDINCRDPLDRNALIICIDNKNLEAIRLLLTARGIKIGDALLYAIQEDFVEAVELLANHWSESVQGLAEEEQDFCFFSCDMTPLMLAAQKNNLEIVKLLLDRGVSPIAHPHDPRCGCAACGQAHTHDCLKHSRARINTYRALSSPSLMALSSADPLKTAFEMSAKLEALAQLEPEYKEDYMRLRRKCQTFATKLLDYTRTSKELEVLLDFGEHEAEDADADQRESGELGGVCELRRPRWRGRRRYGRLARLKLAIECKQKTFCAHPNIQELLATLWYENLPGFRRMSVLNQTLQVLCIGLAFPLYSLAYLVAPNSQLGLYIKRPFIKFICHSASYITFITLLVLASQRVEAFYSWTSVLSLFVGGGGGHGAAAVGSGNFNGTDANFSLFQQALSSGGGATTPLVDDLKLAASSQEVAAAIRALSANNQLEQQQQQRTQAEYDQQASATPARTTTKLVEEDSSARGLDSLRKMFEELPASSKKRGTLPSPIESVILIWVVSLLWAELKQIRALGMNYYKHDMWNLLDSVASGCYMGTLLLRVISYVQSDEHSQEVPREHWHAYDPTLLSEALFATGTIFSSLKLVYIFSVNPYLGPLQISLGRMIVDIVRFSWIYVLVLFAFACGMNQLLWYYADLERHLITTVTTTQNSHDFAGQGPLAFYKASHFSNVFESVQTLFWANFGLVDLENFDLAGIRQYTRFWALLMFGCYCFINVIVVLNLLIAMMNHSYVKISTRSDIEWKFARTRLWMSYFENGSTVPAPFNIIPSIKSCRYALARLFRLISCRKRPSGGPPSRGHQLKGQQPPPQNLMNGIQMKGAGLHGGPPRRPSVTYDTVVKTLVRRYLVDEQRQAEKKSALTEAKLERWSKLNVFAG